MVSIKNVIVTMAVFLLVFSMSAIPGFTAEKPADGANRIADVNVGTNSIQFNPRVEYHQLQLRVSCPNGAVFTKLFKSGQSPILEMVDFKGDSSERDGSYTYEIRAFSKSADKRQAESIYLPSKGAPQSGFFMVKNGSIVPQNQTESATDSPMDQVFIDDLIVSGSLCVGTDCVNGESFGFDTIRLKENNLRIKFQDTSTSASFPSNDWQITINSSDNGGGNYYRIDDITSGKSPFTIEAGAPSNSLYVDDGGRIGNGTASPNVDFHIVSGNTPTTRLEQDGSSGFSPQTWDVAGNEANFFIRDVTNGSALPFRIYPGADSSLLELNADNSVDIGGTSSAPIIKVDSTNKRVGINNTAPSFPLVIDSDSNATLQLNRTTGSVTGFMTAAGSGVKFGSNSAHPLLLMAGGLERMELATNGLLTMSVSGATCTTGGVWTDASSREYKENINELSLEDATAALHELKPVRYNYKVDKEEEYLGFIAEDVPGLVAMNNRKGMNPMDVVAVLTKVLKEQQKTIEKLNERIKKLENSNK